MAIDIIAIDPSKPINNKYAVCSTLPTGFSARLLVRENYPADLTIGSIESKFDNRFDDPSYYFGTGIVDDGDV
jgi:hypothetical protein